jgi:hypothetical protein
VDGGAWRFIFFAPTIMTINAIQALRLLLRMPVQFQVGSSAWCYHPKEHTMTSEHGLWPSMSEVVAKNTESESDYTKQPPFDLAFGGIVANGPPVKVVEKDRCRVCIFPDCSGNKCDCCGGECHWLTLEIRSDGKWYHLVAMPEFRLAVMFSALQDALVYLAKRGKEDTKKVAD